MGKDVTDEYLDAHPALWHAINEATADLMGSPALSAPVERRIVQDWLREPEKRQAMERAFEKARQESDEEQDPEVEPPALLHALDQAMKNHVGNSKLRAIAEVHAYIAWDDPARRADMERAYHEYLFGKH